jgi:hypothetical protein
MTSFLHHWIHLFRGASAKTNGSVASRVPTELLTRARSAIRRGKIDLAESLLCEAGEAIWSDAQSLNLLGLVAEARGEWRQARRLWGRSARTGHKYAPAYQNLRRYFELFQWGRCRDAVAFGDEPQFQIDLQEASS